MARRLLADPMLFDEIGCAASVKTESFGRGPAKMADFRHSRRAATVNHRNLR
jgi:hypothetical protein